MRKIFTLVALLSALAFTAKAEVINGSCAGDNVNVDWSYDTKTKTLSFTLKGSDGLFIPDYGESTKPWQSYIEDIEYLYLPEGLTAIGSWAFSGAKSIRDVVLPQSLLLLDQYAFKDCYSLHTLAIGPNLSTIGQHALNGCYSLTNLDVPDNVQTILYSAFDLVPNVSYSEAREDKPIQGARTVNGFVEEPMVYEAEDRAILSACSAVAKGYIRVADGVETISNHAFYSCFDITTVELPNSVDSVGDNAFVGCDAVQTLIIGSGLRTTDMYAFSMKNLKNVVCMAVTPPDLGRTAFYATNKSEANLYVPDESLELYEDADQWRDFGNKVPLSQIPAGIIDGSTGLDQTNDQMRKCKNEKILKDGQLLILRDNRFYTVTGQEVR